MRPRRLHRGVESVRAVLRVVALVIGLTLLAPRGAYPQSEHKLRVPQGALMIDKTLPASGEYIADKVYERWWREIAQCQALPLPPSYKYVRWFQLNALFFADSAVAAAEEAEGKEISWALGKAYLFEWSTLIALPYRYDEETIKHEMVHWLLFLNGISVGGHHAPYYGRCGVYEKYSDKPYRAYPWQAGG